MSRSGYTDDGGGWDLIRWRGQVASAIRGKRGQQFLREMLAALDAMPVKRLIRDELVHEGEVCAMGAVAVARGMDTNAIDAEEPEEVAAAFGIARQLAQEIAYENDEGGWTETPEERFARVRAWIVSEIRVRPDELLDARDVEDPPS